MSAVRASAVSEIAPTLLASAPAIVLAVLAAACFAGAASLQHRAIDTVSDDGDRLGLAAFKTLLSRPGWLAGLGLAGAGSAMHAVALVLSPLSVVQPIGVLAVPIAVLLTVRRTGRRPGRGVVLGVLLSVAGVASFVTIAAGSTVATRVPEFATLIAAGISAGLVVLLTAVALVRTGWVRCVAYVTAGAVAFGLVSALVRALSLQITQGQVAWTDPRLIGTAAGIGVALLIGGWLVQQGFASGPPEVVIGCLTVVDPIVAVLLGILILGEGPATSGSAAIVLLAVAVAAGAGVVSLARYHPEATGRATPTVPEDPPADPLPAHAPTRRPTTRR